MINHLTNVVRQDVLQECLVDYLDVDGLLLLGFELPLPLVVQAVHVLVLPVHEQQVDPADADEQELGVVTLVGAENALVAEVLPLEQVAEVSDDVEDDEGVQKQGGE